MSRQRKLNENAVDGFVGVQRSDQVEKPGLADISGRAVLDGMKPEFARQLELASHINLAGGIFAGEHNREPRRTSRRGDEGGGALRHLALDLGRYGHAVQDHRFSHQPYLFFFACPPPSGEDARSLPIFSINSSASPPTATDFTLDFWPDAKATLDLGTPSQSATSARSAAFALPSSGGVVT